MMTHLPDQVIIRVFQPEDLGWIVDRHVVLYEKEQGFDHTFRNYVEDPVKRFGETMSPENENLWVAEVQKRRIGIIAVVRVDDTTAQLRWYLVEPETRGHGVGKLLMKTAIEFCRSAGYHRVFLWTVSQLDAARHLYQAFGFEMTEREEHSIWGRLQTEERWDMPL